MNLNKRLTSTIIGLGVGSVLIFGALGIPSILSIRTLRADIAESYADIEKRYDLRQHTRSSLATLEELGPTLHNLSGMVLIEGQELKFISALEQAASQSGVTQDLALETVNQKDISPWERDIPIRIQVGGSYREVLEFMERFEGIPYFVVVRSLDMSVGGQVGRAVSGGDQSVRADVRGTIRWFAKNHPIFGRIGVTDSAADELSLLNR